MTPEEQIQVLAEGLATIYSGATTDEGSALRDFLDDRGVRLVTESEVAPMRWLCSCGASGEGFGSSHACQATA